MINCRAFAVLLLLGTALTARSLPGADLQLEYLGHTGVPQVPFEQSVYEAGRHFGWSPGVFCYVPERDAFFLMGHRNHQLIAEISNPGPGRRAELKHAFVDLTGGGLERLSQETGATILIESLLHARGRVFVSGEKWYNVDNQLVPTHGSCRADLSDPQFEGWWRIGSWSGQATGFYMTDLPDRHVRDGYWLLTGGSVSWRVSSSAGPCAILAAPDNTRPGDQIPARELLRYAPDPNRERMIQLRNPADRGRSRYAGSIDGWMGNCNIGGVAVIGNRLVYFGRQGQGFDFYGPAQEYRDQTGLPEPHEGKGYQCGPYQASMWVYNLDGLMSGRREHARIEFPWALSPRGHADLRNACVHGDRLYVCEAFAEYFGEEPLPVIHVLRIRRQNTP